MQNYINPIELLNLNTDIQSGLDSLTILKAKKKILAEIELSGSFSIIIKGQELNKSDCLKIIDELDNNDKKDFHLFIFQNKALNNFLSKGDLLFFQNYKVESIYNLDDFIDFISPYFSQQYEKALSKNFKKQQLSNVKHLLSIKPIVNKSHIDECYKSTYSVVKEIENEIIQTTKEIVDNKNPHINNEFQDLPELIKTKVNVELLNLLPSYFQSLRNQLAQSIRFLARDINNDPFEIYKPAFEIINIAYNISTDGLIKQDITKAYFIIKGNYDKYGSKLLNASTQKTSSNNNNLGQTLEVQFKARVNKKSISINQKFKIEFSVNADGDDFTPPSFNGFKVIEGPKVEVNQSWVDGKILYNKTYYYYLIPLEKGTLTIKEATIVINGHIYKTDPIEINGAEISSQNNQSKNNEKKEVTKDLFYWLFLCFSFALGFFFNPIQKIILSISLLTLLIPILALKKDENISTSLYLKQNIIFILAASLGFFYPIIAQLYISYYFVKYIISFYGSVFEKNIKNILNNDYTVTAAIILTFIYNSSLAIISTLNESKNENTTIAQAFTDQEFYNNGLNYFNQSNFKDAIIQFDSVISKNPNYVEAYEYRGICKAYLKQYDVAISDYEKAEQLGLKTTTLYSNIGDAYYKLQKSKIAMSFIEKALLLDSKNSFAYRIRGDIKYDANNNKGAEEDYAIAIKINPSSSNYFARGLAYYYLKDYKKAIQDMNKAIELNPDYGQYYFDRGDTKDLINDFDGACRDWKTAKEKGYDVPEYKINRCTPQIVYVSNGDLKGCNETEPKFNKKLDNELLITVGENASVAVKMINKTNEKCIRYVYINKGTTYSIRNIPEGIYYLKIAYGDDWSIMKEQPNCSGRFTKNTLFEKGKEILDYNLKHNGNRYKIPSFSLTLNVITSESSNDNNSTFNTNKINENDFYNE